MPIQIAAMRPSVRVRCKASAPITPLLALCSRRVFLTAPAANATQTLVATRTLPYALDDLYELVADVDSYSKFVPFCTRSRVTQWSAPDATGRRWPTLADLHVSWHGVGDDFTSRLRCVPGTSVEATSGEAAVGTSIGASDNSTVFRSLVTVWSLRPVSAATSPEPSTEVNLKIRYQFSNPLYAAVSSVISNRVAPIIIEAFEKRARLQLSRHY